MIRNCRADNSMRYASCRPSMLPISLREHAFAISPKLSVLSSKCQTSHAMLAQHNMKCEALVTPATWKPTLPIARLSHASSQNGTVSPPMSRLGRKRSTATLSASSAAPSPDSLAFRSRRLASLTSSSCASFAKPAKMVQNSWISSLHTK